MELEKNLTNWKSIEAKIIAKALTDEAFRTRLEQDPNETIENEFNCKLGDNIKFTVKEEDAPGEITIMIPRLPEDQMNEKLTDAEVDNIVAAGNIGIAVGVVTTDIVLVKAIV